MNDEIILPRWDARFKIVNNECFSDLSSLVVTYFNFYDRIYQVLAPYEARQRQVEKPDDDAEYKYDSYTPPTLSFLESNIRRGSIPEKVYSEALKAMVKFCTENKGRFALHDPHPATLHSVQLPKGAFFVKDCGDKQEIRVLGLKRPIIVEGLKRGNKVQHMVIRPKAGTTGLPDLSKWDVIIFNEYFGYIPLWADSKVNPKFAGAL